MLEAKIMVENRVYPRIPIKIHVGYRVITDQKEMERVLIRRRRQQEARTMDMSLGGMHILANHALKEGSILRLYISLQGGEKILAPIAEVVWSRDKGGGLRFISMHQEEKEHLRAYLEKVSYSN
jgi:c-di-GMP-binding flagellar brake protein YcgR